MRRVTLLLVTGLVLASSAPACSRGTLGPAQPVAEEQLAGPEGIDVAAARQTAIGFVSAYADSSSAGVGPLRALVAGSDLRSWVRWLGVQNREFDGTIDGVVDLRSADFVGTVPIRKAIGAEVDLGAAVTFSYSPADGVAFERTRVLDGPMTLVRAGTGEWRVVDVTRDGVSMDAGITLFDGQTRSLAGLSVRLDSVFRFQPDWQFNLVVTNSTNATIGLDPTSAALVIHASGGAHSDPTIPSPSLAAIAPGATVEGLVGVPYQDTARGRFLSLPFLGSDGRLRRFRFALGGLIGSLPGPSTGAGSSPAPAST